MKTSVGFKLQRIREQRGMTQEKFAELLSLSQSSYSRLERGDGGIDFEQLARFAERLEVPVQELLPESLAFYGGNNNGHGHGIGNSIYGADAERVQALERENVALRETVETQRALIEALRRENESLRK